MKNFLHHCRGRGIIVVGAALLSLSLLVWAGCDVTQVQGPEMEPGTAEVATLSRANPQVRAAMAIQERATDGLMGRPGVVGVGTGMQEDGRAAIVVMVVSERASRLAELPNEIERVPVKVLVTGEIKALKGKPDRGGGDDDVDHTARFERPVPLGTSTDHPDITAGTIGARVTNGTNV